MPRTPRIDGLIKEIRARLELTRAVRAIARARAGASRKHIRLAPAKPVLDFSSPGETGP
jgi:hypothetical protein